MQCVILAGGLGTRMRPQTETIPKALIPVLGVPFVDHQLRWLGKHGVTNAVFCIGYLGHQLSDFVGDGSRYGVKAVYVDEGKNLRGTAGAIRLALDAGVLDPAFLLTYGDSYLPIDNVAVWDAFIRSKQPALMTIFKNGNQWDRSNVFYDGKSPMLYDKSKSDPALTAKMQHIDYGMSAWQRDVFAQRVPANTVMDLAAIQHALSVEGKMAALEVTQRFYEAGSPDGVVQLEKYLEST